MITGERLKVLGMRVLSIKDDIIDEVALNQHLKFSSIIGFEEF